MDLAGSAALLLVAAPLFVLIALAIIAVVGGIAFMQRKPGRGGRRTL
jgi:lipopolysaccharide/colanic/teichoic acid biosynthesis glycosyltransferase